jgi:hypothetical protein
MMRFRLIMLGLLAVFALSAVGAASASAETKICQSGLPHLVFCFHDNTEIGTPPQAVLGTSGLSLLTGVALGANIKLHCKKDTFTGQLELLGRNHGTISFKECVLVEPSNCKLGATEETAIPAVVLSQLIGTIAKPEVLFASLTGTAGTIAEFKIIEKSGCAVIGNYPVTGEQICELPNGTVALVEHEIKCTKAKLLLKVGGNSAGFSSIAQIHLGAPHEGLPFYVGLGT